MCLETLVRVASNHLDFVYSMCNSCHIRLRSWTIKTWKKLVKKGKMKRLTSKVKLMIYCFTCKAELNGRPVFWNWHLNDDRIGFFVVKLYIVNSNRYSNKLKNTEHLLYRLKIVVNKQRSILLHHQRLQYSSNAFCIAYKLQLGHHRNQSTFITPFSWSENNDQIYTSNYILA